MAWEDDNNQKRLTIWLPDRVHQWLKENAKNKNITMSKTIRRAIVRLMLQEETREKE
jgi:hypothetical protein